MKNLMKKFVLMFTLVFGLFFTTSCFDIGGGSGVAGETYVVTHAEVRGSTFTPEELEAMNWRMEGEVGKTIIFEKGGNIGSESTLKRIQGIQTLSTWSQSGDTITFNGGSNLYPLKAHISDGKLIIEMGSSQWSYVNTLEKA